MVPRRLFPLVAVSLCVGSPAMGAEWWWTNYYGDRPDRKVEFVDRDSLTSDYASRISAWSFQINESLQSDGVRKKKILSRYNCKARTITLIAMISYGNNDKLLKSFSWESYEQEEHNVVPDTIGETNWDFVCKGKAQVTSPLNGSPEEFAAAIFKTDGN